jgi:hypothetical protein
MNMHTTIDESVSKQRIGKHTTVGVFLEMMFYIQSVQSCYKEESSWAQKQDRNSNKYLVMSTRWGSTPRLAD